MLPVTPNSFLPIPYIEQSSDFWFSEETIIIHAVNAQIRVHKGVPAGQSAAFKVPTASEEAYVEGYPVVRVYDAKSDWKNLVKVIYPPHKYVLSCSFFFW